MSINGFDDEPPQDKPLHDDSLHDDSLQGDSLQGDSPRDDSLSTARRPRRISLRFVAGSIVLGVALGLIVTLVLLILSSRGQPPRMTAEGLKAAERRWRDHGPASYTMEIEQSGGINGKIHVEVRSEQVTAMHINGETAPPRLWDNWSVPGLFEIIQLDLDRNQQSPDSPVVFQQAEFDAANGLPRVYRRSELSAGQTVEWRIVAFRPLP